MNIGWHAMHKLNARATPMQRLAWHEAHQKHCGCGPVPMDVARMLPPSAERG